MPLEWTSKSIRPPVPSSSRSTTNLWRLLATDIGFDRRNLLVVSVDAQSPISASVRGQAGEPDRLPYYAELLRRVRETPGVRLAALSFKPPISNEEGSWWTRVAVEGAAPPAVSPRARTYLNAVSPDHFATLGVTLLAGRDFTAGDRDGSPRVAIINASLARAHFGQASPIGRYLVMHDDDEKARLEVVGLVRDSTYQHLQEEPRRVAYLPYTQAPEFLSRRNLVVEVRAAGQPGPVGEALRRAVRQVDASAPLSVQSVEARIDESLVSERLITVIAVFLGVVSLVLACGALGGLLAHLVAGRTREIGLRLALGAEQRTVMAMVLRDGLTLVGFGAIGGLALTLAGGRLVEGFLYNLKPSDPVALGAATLLLVITAALAGYLPARRAARVDPMVALRTE